MWLRWTTVPGARTRDDDTSDSSSSYSYYSDTSTDVEDATMTTNWCSCLLWLIQVTLLVWCTRVALRCVSMSPPTLLVYDIIWYGTPQWIHSMVTPETAQGRTTQYNTYDEALHSLLWWNKWQNLAEEPNPWLQTLTTTTTSPGTPRYVLG